jgi:hypothetical protein
MSEVGHLKDSNKRYYTTDDEQNSKHEKPNQVHQAVWQQLPQALTACLPISSVYSHSTTRLAE